jgi:hypothetical protein
MPSSAVVATLIADPVRLQLSDAHIVRLAQGVDGFVSERWLDERVGAKGLPLRDTLAVGDGANDLAILKAAGLGVAYRAKPKVAANADARLDHGDLTALLCAQGIERKHFVDG